MSSINRQQFKANYMAAQSRAIKCANGIGVSVEDRLTLNSQRLALGLSLGEAARLINGTGSGNDYIKHYSRFQYWEDQVKRGVIRRGAPATGEYVGAAQETTPFDGRIKSRADVQPAFNRAALQLVKVGITSPEQAQAYLNSAFDYVRVEQKCDRYADRIVSELQMGTLDKDQILKVLDKVKAKF